MSAELRIARESALATLNLLILVGVVALLVDGIEQARALATLGIAFSEFATRVAARVPGQAMVALPVVTALAAAQVALRWKRTGRFDTWQLCGRSPVRLIAAATTGSALVVLLTAGVREGVAPWAAPVLAGDGTWIAVLDPDLPDGHAMVSASEVAVDSARGIRVAWISQGRLVATESQPVAVWDGEWTSDLPLPPPELWREQSVQSGLDASTRAMLARPPSAPRSAWLTERVTSPIGAIAWAALAVGLVWLRGRQGAAAALILVVGWRLVHIGSISLAARGIWPESLAVVVTALAVVGALQGAWRLEVGPPAAGRPTSWW